jgi:hypothetical protein
VIVDCCDSRVAALMVQDDDVRRHSDLSRADGN